MPRVRVAVVERAPVEDVVVLHGVTRATAQVSPAFAVGGTVASVEVRMGDVVGKGAILATLDATPWARQVDALDQSLAGAREALAQAERDVTRLEAMADAQTVAVQQMEQARSQRDQARASIDSLTAQRQAARWNRNQAVLKSPQAGVVVQRMVEPGSVVSSGSPAFEVRASSGVELELGVPERALDDVRSGSVVSVSFPLSDLTPRGATIAAVSDASAEGGLFPARVLLDDPELRPGLSATVHVRAPRAPALSVPLAAVVSPAGDAVWVHRVREGMVDRIAIETGPVRDDRLEVSGGLEAGDEVVVSGHAGLRAGVGVEVVR